MNRFRIERRRLLAELHPKKKIGGTDKPELMNIKGNRKLYIYADTETFYDTKDLKPWEHDGKPLISKVLEQMDVYPFIISWQFRRHKTSKDNNIYEAGGFIKRTLYIDDIFRIEELLNHISYIFNELGYTPVLAFHNSSYDLCILEHLFKALDPDLIFYYYTDDKKKFIKGSMQSKKYNFFCEFDDTYKYSRVSIETAGGMLGLPKMKGLPYALCDVYLDDQDNVCYKDLYTGEDRKFPLSTYLEYAERDVDIARKLHELMTRRIDIVNNIMVEDWTKMTQFKFNRRCKTQPQHSKAVCDKYLERLGWAKIDETFRFDIAQILCPNPLELYQQTMESNCGGFTTFNKDIRKYDCHEDEVIKYFDRNSMYPTIMSEELPYGDLLKEPPAKRSYTTWYLIRVSSCQWKGKLSCLRDQGIPHTKINDRRSFFIEKEYYDFVNENSFMEAEILDTFYQSNTTVIRNLITMYYTKRKECKSRMNEMEANGLEKSSRYDELNNQQESLKLLMNSLYGKMCETGHHTGIVYYESQYSKFKSDTIEYPCILTGSFITYRGRLSLLQKIKAVVEAGYTFLYGDTDSVTLACPKDTDLTEIFGTDQGNLGEWKMEGWYDLYLNGGVKKKYALINRRDRSVKPKLALSGIMRETQDIIKNQLKEDFDNTVRDLIFIFDPTKNVLIERCKKNVVYTLTYNQPVFYNSHFKMNSKVKAISGRIKIRDGKYKLEICQ